MKKGGAGGSSSCQEIPGSILTLPSQLFRVFPIREHDLATTGTEQYLDTGTGLCCYVLLYRAFHSMLKQGYVMG